MKKKILSIAMLVILLSTIFNGVAFAQSGNSDKYDDIIISRGSILTWDDFAAIKVEMEKGNGKITDEQAKKLIGKKIIEKEKMSDSSISAQYTIWGMNLNAAELALVVLYPVEAIYVYNDAQTALSEAQYYYNSNTLYQGNGDAFRHAYWNALMTKHIGSWMAYLFATAHESTTPDGIDKTMDLNNNEIGRNIGIYYSWSVLESTVMTYVNNGWLYRIVNGQLTVTDSSGRIR